MPTRAAPMANAFEVFRFRSAARSIAQVLGLDPPSDCMVRNGRTTVTFRRLGGSRWPEPQQMEFARQAASAVRRVFAEDGRRQLRSASTRAIVVTLEDAALVDGCAVTARWECIVPGTR
jgi:hypothetical protein